MASEKEKMLAGELYQPWDDEIHCERIACRRWLHQLNNSLPNSEEWQDAIESLLPQAKGEVYLEPPFYCDYGSNILVGENFYANFGCTILDANRVVIGDNVMLAPNVQIYTATHPLDVQTRVTDCLEYAEPINIGDNVWIGGASVICPGVIIGENSVIGAGSVVTKDIPANVVAAGNPCKVIREIEQ
ncbi:sugar O-acetyltransferase [Vibrio nigripulchritudo]|uniref:sugar O-acetyltransferase n=1 Tax=Vibrio nigripulchritudo TaxID=28173 RepID=UPI0005F9FE33|nr:sugar O-acetyltransferase [Vibrio nigripulchritudo]KJY67895.1 maltose acetyltransferase [Vibrio nigripulchritudo]